MPESFIPTPVDPGTIGRKVRSRQRTIGANTIEEQYVIPTNDRVITGRFLAATFRITSTGATPHPLFSIENTTGSAIIVAVWNLSVEIQVNAVTANLVAGDVRMWRGTTVPTGGTTMTKNQVDTGETASAANVVLRSAASADATASAITYATPSANPFWSQSTDKIMTGVGQWGGQDLSMLPDGDELVLRAGQSALVAVIGIMPTHYLYTVKCRWDEYTIP